jgi:hypothetical protein
MLITALAWAITAGIALVWPLAWEVAYWRDIESLLYQIEPL